MEKKLFTFYTIHPEDGTGVSLDTATIIAEDLHKAKELHHEANGFYPEAYTELSLDQINTGMLATGAVMLINNDDVKEV